MNNFEDILESLTEKKLRVCVVGIGRIGLPTALSFAKSGLETIGVDINENLVQQINSGKFPLKDEPGYEEIFNDVIKNKKFSSTTKIEEAVPLFPYLVPLFILNVSPYILKLYSLSSSFVTKHFRGT